MLQYFRDIKNILLPLKIKKDKIKSKRLLALIELDSQDKLFEAISELDHLVIWKTVSDGAGHTQELPFPREGLDPSFDEANAIVEEYKDRIHCYINGIKDKLKSKFTDPKL